MSKSTQQRIALVLSAINVRRLIPGFQPYVNMGRDFWLIDIYRPIIEIRSLLNRWNPSGIISEWIPEKTESILDLGYPTTLVTSREIYPRTVTIDVDNESIGQSVADHFWSQGLRHFAFYGNLNPYSHERLQGFKDYLKNKGYPVEVFSEDTGWLRQYIEHWHESDKNLIKWIQSIPKPVGVLVAHDPLGRSLAEACREAKFKIPEDVAIVGVNDDELVCGMTNPPLSSVRVPWQKMGYEAGQEMEKLIQNPNQGRTKTKILPHEEIVIRASSDQLAVTNPKLSQALRIIREQAASGLQVKDVVNQVKVSRRYLEQIFQFNLKRTPREEIIRIRMNKARQLLRETDFIMPIIAEECGFSSAELLATNFKKQFKQSPRDYRSSFRIEAIR